MHCHGPACFILSLFLSMSHCFSFILPWKYPNSISLLWRIFPPLLPVFHWLMSRSWGVLTFTPRTPHNIFPAKKAFVLRRMTGSAVTTFKHSLMGSVTLLISFFLTSLFPFLLLPFSFHYDPLCLHSLLSFFFLFFLLCAPNIY